ncbi:Oidioi.mRNA.OKI2018_I69.YSR.g17091.t1.cds [Oikopleura dioica]|uniref:Oidioi.mRNA.OKI2018_I69.YSR.g17091.t1.cds n=1 Tax=Oikopleura dioica TaxID=34765 RepID=A0ABN7SLX0_OIKDI|nr:Oidioi.mRNA.OKI2018_I69.YSR.g17091.t1.cds [Oikopleura dioica]
MQNLKVVMKKGKSEFAKKSMLESSSPSLNLDSTIESIDEGDTQNNQSFRPDEDEAQSSMAQSASQNDDDCSPPLLDHDKTMESIDGSDSESPISVSNGSESQGFDEELSQSLNMSVEIASSYVNNESIHPMHSSDDEEIECRDITDESDPDFDITLQEGEIWFNLPRGEPNYLQILDQPVIPRTIVTRSSQAETRYAPPCTQAAVNEAGSHICETLLNSEAHPNESIQDNTDVMDQFDYTEDDFFSFSEDIPIIQVQKPAEHDENCIEPNEENTPEVDETPNGENDIQDDEEIVTVRMKRGDYKKVKSLLNFFVLEQTRTSTSTGRGSGSKKTFNDKLTIFLIRCLSRGVLASSVKVVLDEVAKMNPILTRDGGLAVNIEGDSESNELHERQVPSERYIQLSRDYLPSKKTPNFIILFL